MGTIVTIRLTEKRLEPEVGEFLPPWLKASSQPVHALPMKGEDEDETENSNDRFFSRERETGSESEKHDGRALMIDLCPLLSKRRNPKGIRRNPNGIRRNPKGIRRTKRKLNESKI